MRLSNQEKSLLLQVIDEWLENVAKGKNDIDDKTAQVFVKTTKIRNKIATVILQKETKDASE